MPFAGLVSDSEGSTSIFQTAMNNFMEVLSGLIKGIYGILMKPVYPILNIFTTILGSFSSILQKLQAPTECYKRISILELFQNLLVKIHEGNFRNNLFFTKIERNT